MIFGFVFVLRVEMLSWKIMSWCVFILSSIIYVQEDDRKQDTPLL